MATAAEYAIYKGARVAKVFPGHGDSPFKGKVGKKECSRDALSHSCKRVGLENRAERREACGVIWASAAEKRRQMADASAAAALSPLPSLRHLIAGDAGGDQRGR